MLELTFVTSPKRGIVSNALPQVRGKGVGSEGKGKGVYKQILGTQREFCQPGKRKGLEFCVNFICTPKKVIVQNFM